MEMEEIIPAPEAASGATQKENTKEEKTAMKPTGEERKNEQPKADKTRTKGKKGKKQKDNNPAAAALAATPSVTTSEQNLNPALPTAENGTTAKNNS